MVFLGCRGNRLQIHVVNLRGDHGGLDALSRKEAAFCSARRHVQACQLRQPAQHLGKLTLPGPLARLLRCLGDGVEARIPETYLLFWCVHGEALATAKLVSAWHRSSQRSTVNMSTSSEICPSPERAECKRGTNASGDGLEQQQRRWPRMENMHGSAVFTWVQGGTPQQPYSRLA
ncbi:uncharacterized protein LOC144102551 [Amblyomma americanum]